LKRTEIRDGQEFEVTVLPDVDPPKNRSAKTRYHFVDVDKPGNLSPYKRRTKRRKAKGPVKGLSQNLLTGVPGRGNVVTREINNVERILADTAVEHGS